MRWHCGLLATAFLAGTLHAAALPSDPFCAARTDACLRPSVAILSAFPAELQPLLAATDVTETIATGERTYHLGRLAGKRVVLVRGGIGLVNAATTAHGVLDRFPVSLVAFSGVAGSGLEIGDVAVPATWTDHTATFRVSKRLLARARRVASGDVSLQQCNQIPPNALPPAPPAGTVVCFGPRKIVVGGAGESADPFNGGAFRCSPGSGPVFGCDEVFPAPTAVADASDMETAAVARAAHERRVPFIGFRGVSDGPGDPLGLPGFPTQFFAYYPISAANAAATAIAFLGHTRPARPRAAVTVRAACDWPRALGPVCAGERPPRALTQAVDRACATLADGGNASGEWATAAQLLGSGGSHCRRALADALRARAVAAQAPVDGIVRDGATPLRSDP